MESLVLTDTLRIVLSLAAAGGTIYILWSKLKRALRTIQFVVIGLVVTTALLHFLSGANDNLLFLNGLGYMGLLTALYFLPLGPLSSHRAWVYGVLGGYTLLTLVLYFVVHPWGMHAGEIDGLGWFTKFVEVLLLAALGIDFKQSLQPGASSAELTTGQIKPPPAVVLPLATQPTGNGKVVPGLGLEAVPVPALEVKGLKFSYPDKPGVLKGVSVSLMPHERLGLIGPNGAGKTTFFMLICGVQKAEAGEISLFGQPVKHRDFHPEIGMVFQNSTDQLFSPTVRDDIAFGPQNLGLAPDEVETRVNHALTTTGVSELADRPPHHLSGGERRMVSIAGILAMEPQLILYDEPSANLDIRSRRRLINFLKASNQAYIVSAHDLEFILEVCNRVLLLDEGRIIADGDPRVVMADAALMEAHGLEKPHSLRPHPVPHHAA
jgi:cobalt/nickel transport system ATP-binding protein